MTVSLDKMLDRLPAARRAKVEARAREIVAEEKTLRELRRARALTQQRLARTLGIKQDGVSRIERRGDLKLSTLQDYVAAMGGRLELVAHFPDSAPVSLKGLEAFGAPAAKPGKRRAPRRR